MGGGDSWRGWVDRWMGGGTAGGMGGWVAGMGDGDGWRG